MKNKKWVAVLCTFLLVFSMGAQVAAAAELGERLLFYGDSGNDVYELQDYLNRLGYPVLSVDGEFGAATLEAVLAFQRDQGLFVDGVVGPYTYHALLANLWIDDNRTRGQLADRSISRTRLSPDDIYLLAQLIHAEAAGEPYEGKVAVGAVVMNRLRDPEYPKSIREIIFDHWQFEPVQNGTIYNEPDSDSLAAAKEAASGVDPTGGALFFYAPDKSSSPWVFTRPIIKQIGHHVFAR